MLRIWMGPANSGKSEQVLREIRRLGDESFQLLLVPEHASHQAEVDLCRFCGPTAARHGEVLSFRLLANRVLALTEVQLEGKKRMDTEAFLRGYEVLPGTVLGQEEA